MHDLLCGRPAGEGGNDAGHLQALVRNAGRINTKSAESGAKFLCGSGVGQRTAQDGDGGGRLPAELEIHEGRIGSGGTESQTESAKVENGKPDRAVIRIGGEKAGGAALVKLVILGRRNGDQNVSTNPHKVFGTQLRVAAEMAEGMELNKQAKGKAKIGGGDVVDVGMVGNNELVKESADVFKREGSSLLDRTSGGTAAALCTSKQSVHVGGEGGGALHGSLKERKSRLDGVNERGVRANGFHNKLQQGIGGEVGESKRISKAKLAEFMNGSRIRPDCPRGAGDQECGPGGLKQGGVPLQHGGQVEVLEQGIHHWAGQTGGGSSGGPLAAISTVSCTFLMSKSILKHKKINAHDKRTTG
jgi:hypothetical protein